jgi:hypothetical protein
MVLTFFNSKDVIYTNHLPWGTIVNTDYIIETPKKFLKACCQKRPKRPELAPGKWMFHWDNDLVHTADEA